MKKILIVKCSALGDIVHVFPTLEYLKNQFPEAEIDWVVEKRGYELVARHPLVSRAISIEKPFWRKLWSATRPLREVEYDCVYDFQGNSKSALVLACTRAKQKVGFKHPAEWINRFFTNKKIEIASQKNIREDYLALVGGNQLPAGKFLYSLSNEEAQLLNHIKSQWLERPVFVAPGAAWPNKRLPLERLRNILPKNAFLIFSTGSAVEKEIAMQLHKEFSSMILPPLSLPLLQHVMAGVEHVIAMDSLPLHLCATTNTPTLSFFGPTCKEKYKPLGQEHKGFQGACPYNVHFEKRCPKLRTCKNAPCIKQVEIKMSGQER